VLHHIRTDSQDFEFSFLVGNSAGSPFVNLPDMEHILKLTTHLVYRVMNQFSICLNGM